MPEWLRLAVCAGVWGVISCRGGGVGGGHTIEGKKKVLEGVEIIERCFMICPRFVQDVATMMAALYDGGWMAVPPK